MPIGCFKLKDNNSNFKTEFLAGLTTFLTMSYVIFANPDILSAAGMDKSALIAITCIVTAVATIAVGLFANSPIAMAPGMGLNAFFAYSLVITDKINWPTALGVVFLSGLFFLILTAVGLRKKLVEAIPPSLISGISVGIGLFITFIGLRNMGIIIDDPATLVRASDITPTIMIGLAGLMIMIFLEIKKIVGSLLIGIIFSTVLAAAFGFIEPPQKIVSLDFNLGQIALQLDIMSAFKWSLAGSIFTLMFIDMFDSIGTLVACSHVAGLTDEKGSVRNIDRLLTVDALATMFGAVCGTSTTTAYIESAAGIEQGGKTGLTAIVTGLFFLVAVIFVPLVGVVPSYATAGALVMVGLFMIKEIRSIDFADIQESFPAFIIMIMIALSYSISTGLAFGFIAYTIIKIVTGNITQVKPAMWIITVLSIIHFIV
ncbi:MAG: NCS2 family permease [Sedimentisphaerales bacterium]|nr:NCS2 family permease [Sedimentisphaerales bacterium]